MDEYLIFEFSTIGQAQTCLDEVDALIAQHQQNSGYTVVNGDIIGKNEQTGADAPTAQKTVTWDEIKTSPDGTFYFSSPMRYTLSIVTPHTEKIFPET